MFARRWLVVGTISDVMSSGVLTYTASRVSNSITLVFLGAFLSLLFEFVKSAAQGTARTCLHRASIKSNIMDYQ